MNKRTIYFDNSATTPLLPEVKEKIINYLDDYGNPSSLYQIGVDSREAINYARSQIADALNVNSDRIIFTSGASESNSMVIKSIYDMLKSQGNHIITSKIEHHSILECLHYMEKYHGANVTYLNVDNYGRVDPVDVGKAITEKTILISIMSSNNEIGTIQNISSINNIAKSYGILFHSDATQSFIKQQLEIKDVDILSISAHKIGGPKGVGALYVKNGIDIPPLITGTQENGHRGGTENLLGIVGFGEASYISSKNM